MRNQLRSRVSFLGAVVGRELKLDVWCPGDGFCRYRVYETEEYGLAKTTNLSLPTYRGRDLMRALDLATEAVRLAIGDREYERRATAWIDAENRRTRRRNRRNERNEGD